MRENIYAFIDSQNLNLGVSKSVTRFYKRLYTGWKLDFKKFYIYLKEKHKVTKAFIFIGYVAGNESLYKSLQEYGYTLIFKPTLEYETGSKKVIKGNVDAELVMHSILELPNYTSAILVAGDGDYHCLIEHLVKIKKLQKILIPNKFSFSSLLRKYRKYMVFVNELKSKLAYQKKEREYSKDGTLDMPSHRDHHNYNNFSINNQDKITKKNDKN